LSSAIPALRDTDIETFHLNGKEYIHDEILSFLPTVVRDDAVKMSVKGRQFSLPRKVLTRVKTSHGRLVYVISDRLCNDVLSYLMENMSYLATRDNIDGKKWDSLIEIE